MNARDKRLGRGIVPEERVVQLVAENQALRAEVAELQQTVARLKRLIGQTE